MCFLGEVLTTTIVYDAVLWKFNSIFLDLNAVFGGGGWNTAPMKTLGGERGHCNSEYYFYFKHAQFLKQVGQFYHWGLEQASGHPFITSSHATDIIIIIHTVPSHACCKFSISRWDSVPKSSPSDSQCNVGGACQFPRLRPCHLDDHTMLLVGGVTAQFKVQRGYLAKQITKVCNMNIIRESQLLSISTAYTHIFIWQK